MHIFKCFSVVLFISLTLKIYRVFCVSIFYSIVKECSKKYSLIYPNNNKVALNYYSKYIAIWSCIVNFLSVFEIEYLETNLNFWTCCEPLHFKCTSLGARSPAYWQNYFEREFYLSQKHDVKYFNKRFPKCSLLLFV